MSDRSFNPSSPSGNSSHAVFCVACGDGCDLRCGQCTQATMHVPWNQLNAARSKVCSMSLLGWWATDYTWASSSFNFANSFSLRVSSILFTFCINLMCSSFKSVFLSIHLAIHRLYSTLPFHLLFSFLSVLLFHRTQAARRRKSLASALKTQNMAPLPLSPHGSSNGSNGSNGNWNPRTSVALVKAAAAEATLVEMRSRVLPALPRKRLDLSERRLSLEKVGHSLLWTITGSGLIFLAKQREDKLCAVLWMIFFPFFCYPQRAAELAEARESLSRRRAAHDALYAVVWQRSSS